MTRQEHLLTIAAEECAEVAQRIAKALRFGLEQVQEDPDDKPEENQHRQTNRQRIYDEYYQHRAVLGMAGIDAWDTSARARAIEQAKVQRVEQHLERSAHCGTLEPPA